MQAHSILLAAGPDLPCSVRALRASLLDAWPTDPPPEINLRPLDDLPSLVTTASPPSVALVALGPGASAREVDHLVETLLAANLPGVVLSPRPAAWKLLERQGVLFASYATDAAVVAAMLHALAARQEAVRILTTDLAAARRSAGGVREAMDHLHDELHLAAAIQRDFTLAPLPATPDTEIGVLYRPLSFVSGDVYAIQPLGDSLLGFFVADAVGHGVPAAMLTMLLHASLSLSEPGPTPTILQPAQALARLNQRLLDSALGPARFATAVCGLYDARQRRVTIAGAGHPPPVILSPRGTRLLETEGPLLAVFDEPEFTQTTSILEPDESLVIYTDGLEAAFPADADRPPLRFFGNDAPHVDLLRSVLLEDSSDTLNERVAALNALLDGSAGSLHRQDDVTAIVLRPKRATSANPAAALAA